MVNPCKQKRFVSHGDGYLGGTRFVDIYKPIIAAVNGDALAGGLELACLADLRVVEAHAQMGVACRRFNVPLCDGGTQRLPRIIGLGWAMELILTGRFIDALQLPYIGPTLGGVESIIEQPAALFSLDPAECDKAGLPENLVRYALGIENHSDLISMPHS